MSAASPGVVETDAFSAPEYDAMLAEVREHLPLYLQAGATEHHDPLGDVQGITGLDAGDLRRVVAVHSCLSVSVTRFVAALDDGLRWPITSSARPRQAGRTVRGAVDWGATTRARAIGGWDPALFVVRPGQRVVDVPENAALHWTLRQLERAAVRGLQVTAGADVSGIAQGWRARIADVLSACRSALRAPWLQEAPAQRPDADTLRRLEAARTRFHRLRLLPVVRELLRADAPSEQDLVAILCERYFVPDKAWRLFEVVVALRLAREFASVAVGPRRTRLLKGAHGAKEYARYTLPDGDEVLLSCQGWPSAPTASQRQTTAARHGFRSAGTIPDLIVRRQGRRNDCLVLELKASKRRETLGPGLTQLLGYLGERPDMFDAFPAGWLVAPASEAFQPAEQEDGEPLWIVAADDVAAAAVTRLAV